MPFTREQREQRAEQWVVLVVTTNAVWRTVVRRFPAGPTPEMIVGIVRRLVQQHWRTAARVRGFALPLGMN